MSGELGHRLDVHQGWITVQGNAKNIAVAARIPQARLQFPMAFVPPSRVNFLALEAIAPITFASDEYLALRGFYMRPDPDWYEWAQTLGKQFCNPGWEPMHHQLEFVALGAGRRCVYNASEQGTGKTLPAILLSRAWNCTRTLVVCRRDLMLQWEREIQESMNWPFVTQVLDKGTVDQRRERMRSTPAHFQIINYDVMNTMYQELSRQNFDCIIFDEAWRLKNRMAKVSKAAAKLSRGRPVQMMSGTPIGNHLGDYYSQLKILSSDLITEKYDAFLETYAELDYRRIAGRLITKPIGVKNPADLMLRLEQFGWYRATKQTCLNLPDRVYHVVKLKMTDEQKTLYKNVCDYGDSALGREYALTSEAILLVRQQQIAGGHCPDFRNPEPGEEYTLQNLDSCKLNWLRNWVCEELGPDASVRAIIWCKFNAEVETIACAIAQELGEHRVAMVTGKTTNSQLEQIKESFNSRDPEGTQVIVAQIKKMAYGHNLQSCDYMIDYSLSWSHVEHVQKNDRNHRNGREGTCTYITLLAGETVDEYIFETLQRKQNVAARVAPDTVGSRG